MVVLHYKQLSKREKQVNYTSIKCIYKEKKKREGDFPASPVVQWLRFCTSTGGGLYSVSSRGTKILQLLGTAKKKKRMYIFGSS